MSAVSAVGLGFAAAAAPHRWIPVSMVPLPLWCLWLRRGKGGGGRGGEEVRGGGGERSEGGEEGRKEAWRRSWGRKLQITEFPQNI